jgi:hypothetical protein
MAFVPEKAKAAQEERFANGEWKEAVHCGCRVNLVPISHPDFEKALRSKEKKYRSKTGLVGRRIEEPLPPEARNEHFLEAIGEVLVRDWDRVTDMAGNAIPFSHDLCVKFLKEIVDFRMDVSNLVTVNGEEADAEGEVLLGNS